MEMHKNPRVDIEHYRSIFFGIGLSLSLLLVYGAFELKFYDTLEPLELAGVSEALSIEQLDIPNTEQTPPPPPKTVLEQPEIVEVKNEDEIRKDIEINLDVEMSDETIAKKSVYGEGSAETPPPAPPIVEEVEEEIFLVVEEKPEPKGGFSAFYEFIGKNTMYPKMAQQNGIEGKVYVEFVIDKEGKLTDFKVVKGVGFGLDEEALRVLGLAPQWKPGKQRGRPVKVKMTVPIVFKLVN
ncbi:MAG: TonB family protein [Microscillaceae bacterium]|nr:TonB family protein [Microscillaceae bacterium]